MRADALIERCRDGVVALLPHTACGWFSQIQTARSLGWAQSRRLAAAMLQQPGDLLEIQHPRASYPVFFRTASTDVETLEACLCREYYGRLRIEISVEFVIDAGANAGYASVFFLERYAQARVVALEPDPENCTVAERNLSPYGQRVRLLQQAIWPVSTRLALRRTDRYDSTRVEESADETTDCSAVDPISILEMFGRDRISIFKLDIEGAEEALFSRNADPWLERTDSIAMEIHGSGAHRAVYEAVGRHDFASFVNHGLHFFMRR